MLIKVNRMLKIIGSIFPYSCSYCSKRFRKVYKYRNHFLVCEARKAYEFKQNKELAYIAPVNRDQKRKMAKRAGMIKDWGKLNAP
jgi:hypothetical protein